MRLILKASMVAWALGAPALLSAQILTGSPIASAGDTLWFGGQSVLLSGVDAPEIDQTCDLDGVVWSCGADAREVLATLVDGQRVTCQLSGTDVSGQAVGNCSTEFLDLSLAIAELGWAVSDSGVPGALQDAAASAQSRGLGIWRSKFTLPAEHSSMRRKAMAAAKLSGTKTLRPTLPRTQVRDGRGCAIKGNINRRGEWIYHLPGMPYYDVTRAEAFFCTESDAQAAGYRRAIVRR